MARAQTVHGARAKLIIDGTLQGSFSNVSYGLTYDMQPIYTLGRFSPAEIVPVGQEAIAISATGFRIVGNGPHVAAKVPKLQDLLQHEDIELTIEDRQTNQATFKVVGVRPTGYTTAIGARGVQEITVNFLGIRQSDESDGNEGQSESAGATNILDGS